MNQPTRPGVLRTALLASAALALPTLSRADNGAPAADTGVQQITLPVLQPDLPPGPGREAVLTSCVICHSTRYITMQPTFPRKPWEAEVDKMRKVFGAPVADEQAKVIVEYLVAIRGKATPTTRP